jgi:hypothetical protein
VQAFPGFESLSLRQLPISSNFIQSSSVAFDAYLQGYQLDLTFHWLSSNCTCILSLSGMNGGIYLGGTERQTDKEAG